MLCPLYRATTTLDLTEAIQRCQQNPPDLVRADVHDTLIIRRVYKPGMLHDQATKVIVQGRGKQFDPDVVDAFLALGEVFHGIARRYADTDRDLERIEARCGKDFAWVEVSATALVQRAVSASKPTRTNTHRVMHRFWCRWHLRVSIGWRFRFRITALA